ncbi:MAG: hypothetical protein EA369_00595 [Bradymonadales bacterium]|nr:MAG: hypothetical protein EA369_00595 [Bradymonadales bacterium]
MIPFGSPRFDRSRLNGYQLEIFQSDFLSKLRRFGWNNGYLYEEAGPHRNVPMGTFMRHESLRFVETEDGGRFVIFRLSRQQEAEDISQEFPEDKLIRILDALESHFNLIYTHQLTEISEQFARHIEELEELIALDRDHVASIVNQLEIIPDREVMMNSIKQLKSEALRDKLSSMFEALYDQLEARQTAPQVTMRNPGAEEQILDLPMDRAGVASDWQATFNRINVHPKFSEDIEALDWARKAKIMELLKRIANGNHTSNNDLHVPGVLVKDTERTYLVVFQVVPNQEPRILGVTQYTEFQNLDHQRRFIEERSKAFNGSD